MAQNSTFPAVSTRGQSRLRLALSRALAAPALALAVLAGACLPVQAEQKTDLETRLAKLSTEKLEELFAFVGGNTLFTIYHEAGHMLVSEFGLPVLGQEEDAVDNLATVTMLASDTPDMDLYLTNAMIGWFAVYEDDIDSMVFYDEHDLNQQRGYQILCLMAGADREAFGDLAVDLDLPEDRLDQCEDEYALSADSWEIVTEPFLRPEGSKGNRITVKYDPAPAGLSSMEVFLKESELLQLVADEMDALYELPEAVTFRASACEEENAFWDPQAREVTVCYELLEGFAAVYLDVLAD